jgi:hypothetical protein
VALLLGGSRWPSTSPRRHGFQSDESSYYTLGHSLARDGDFAFDRGDLARSTRVPDRPEGIFSKGQDAVIEDAARFVIGLARPDTHGDRPTSPSPSHRWPRRRSSGCSGPAAFSCCTRCCC